MSPPPLRPILSNGDVLPDVPNAIAVGTVRDLHSKGTRARTMAVFRTKGKNGVSMFIEKPVSFSAHSPQESQMDFQDVKVSKQIYYRLTASRVIGADKLVSGKVKPRSTKSRPPLGSSYQSSFRRNHFGT